MKKQIHIISLDVPFPADYGGMIDVFYRIQALHQLGYGIVLHAFTYGRGEPEELKKYCKEVHYYSRKKNVFSLFSKRPFIVQTRRSKEMLQRLLADDNPIIIEGLHCAWLLENPEINQRVTIVRTHNVEHEYYQLLSQRATGWKRFFYQIEANKLRKYEKILSRANYLLAIKNTDKKHFEHWNENVFTMYPSIPAFPTSALTETKEYCLFHGNLSVEENYHSAMRIIQKIAPSLREIKFIIAGKNPKAELIHAMASAENIRLEMNPNEKKMNQLLQEAKVHLLLSEQATGVKLKLMYALQTMGQTIVNTNMVEGTELDEFCSVVDTDAEIIHQVRERMMEKANQETRLRQIEEFQHKYAGMERLSAILKEIGI